MSFEVPGYIVQNCKFRGFRNPQNIKISIKDSSEKNEIKDNSWQILSDLNFERIAGKIFNTYEIFGSSW